MNRINHLNVTISDANFAFLPRHMESVHDVQNVPNASVVIISF